MPPYSLPLAATSSDRQAPRIEATGMCWAHADVSAGPSRFPRAACLMIPYKRSICACAAWSAIIGIDAIRRNVWRNEQMHVVTDSGADFLPEQLGESELSIAPLTLAIAGRVYKSGIDITPEGFYRLLHETQDFATTSQPSPGDFADIYRAAAETDKEILSIHMSSGLSGTLNAARMGAAAVPEADVAFYDTRTLSAGSGWHVEMALRAVRAGWGRGRILSMLEQVSSATETLFTLPTLRYLIHGGRISHLKGLLAQVLNIRPVIGVEKEGGTYVTRGQARTFDGALVRLADFATSLVGQGAKVRAQIVHGYNPEGVARLRAEIEKRLNVKWLGTTQIAPVLGAHTGPGVVGLILAREDALPSIG